MRVLVCPAPAAPFAPAGAWVVRGTGIQADAAIDNAEDGYTAEEIVAQMYPACLWNQRGA